MNGKLKDYRDEPEAKTDSKDEIKALVEQYTGFKFASAREKPRDRWAELERCGLIGNVMYCSDFEIGHRDDGKTTDFDGLLHLSYRPGAF